MENKKLSMMIELKRLKQSKEDAIRCLARGFHFEINALKKSLILNKNSEEKK